MSHNHRRMFSAQKFVLSLVFFTSLQVAYSQTKDKWQRVYTGDDSVIDINLASARLGPNHILEVDYRTVFTRLENIQGKPGAKYKSRIETVRFQLNANRYQLSKSVLLDSNDKEIISYTATTEEWRVIRKGGMMEKLFTAVSKMPPFGSWKVVEYRFAEGPKLSPERDLQKLIGIRVRLQSGSADIDHKVCSSVAYEDRRSTVEELSRALGVVKLDPIIAQNQPIEMVAVKCDVGGWSPTPSLLIKVKDDDMLMLWNGVFLVLKREYDWNGNTLPPFKRARG